MSLNKLIQTIEDERNISIKREKTAARIHLFYEGEVTEKQLISHYHASLDSREIVKLLWISNGGNHNNIKNIMDIIEGKEYINEDKVRVKILPSDTIIYIHDWDIFYDYRNGTNLKNLQRVDKTKSQFKETISIIDRDFTDINFNVLPNFPNIEYAILLGMIDDINEADSLKGLQNECAQLISGKIGFKYRKDFNSIASNEELFKMDRMLQNIEHDRKRKLIPKDIYILNDKIISSDFSFSMLDSHTYFSYLDGLSQIYYDMISKKNF